MWCNAIGLVGWCANMSGPRESVRVYASHRHLRRTLREFVTHHHRERNHQGLANELIDGPAAQRPTVLSVVGNGSEQFSAITTGQRRRPNGGSRMGQNGIHRGELAAFEHSNSHEIAAEIVVPKCRPIRGVEDGELGRRSAHRSMDLPRFGLCLHR